MANKPFDNIDDQQFAELSLAGQNLPGFMAAQLDFASHIRNPELHPRPADIEPRRMQIYLDLFFNNVNGFVTNTFPVLKSLMSEARWLQLVRDFFAQHPSESPYFLQVSEEFLTFLHNHPQTDLPEFVLELAHYEWVEMALDVAEDVDLPDFLEVTDSSSQVYVTPYCRLLTYHYPVQLLGPGHQPDSAPEQPTYLVVYRNRADKVRFMESNPVTHRVIDLLGQGSVHETVVSLADELQQAGVQLEQEQVAAQTKTLLVQLAERDIVLGALA